MDEGEENRAGARPSSALGEATSLPLFPRRDNTAARGGMRPNGLEMSRPASAQIVSRIRLSAAGRVGSIELLGAEAGLDEKPARIVEELSVYDDLATVLHIA